MANRRNVRINGLTGFTLVELLVVIAIIGILIGMLLPAVQQVRAAARRSQCSNNIRQLCLGLHNHESAHMKFPPGSLYPKSLGTYPPAQNSKLAQTAGYSWSLLILPFVEQNAAYDATVGTGRLMGQLVADPVTRSFLQTPLSLFRCPSDVGTDLQTAPSESHFLYGLVVQGTDWYIDGSTAGPRVGLATSNYVGLHHHRAHQYQNGQLVYDGVFGPNSERTMGDVSDGTSNTMCVSERATYVGDVLMSAAVWGGVAAAAHDDCIDDAMATARTPINPTQTAVYNQTYFRQQALSSNHENGVMMGLLDGSVHFLSEDVDFVMTGGSNGTIADSVFEYLIAVDDGAVIGRY